MGSVVNAGQVLEIKMGVDLGRGDVRVPEQFLHAANSPLDSSRCEANECLNRCGWTCTARPWRARPVRDPLLDGPRAQAPPGAADEDAPISSGFTMAARSFSQRSSASAPCCPPA